MQSRRVALFDYVLMVLVIEFREPRERLAGLLAARLRQGEKLIGQTLVNEVPRGLPVACFERSEEFARYRFSSQYPKRRALYGTL